MKVISEFVIKLHENKLKAASLLSYDYKELLF